jgi:hypothetical protein
MRRYVLAGVLVAGLAGCMVSASLPGEVTIGEPGVVVEEPPISRWHWGVWPHRDVEHHYIVDDRPVVVEHHHYYPLYDRVHPPVRRTNERRERQDDRRRDHG